MDLFCTVFKISFNKSLTGHMTTFQLVAAVYGLSAYKI